MLPANFYLKGLVGNIVAPSDGGETTARFGRQNDLMVSQLYGPYSEQASRQNVYFASNAAFTMPVNASSLATKFAVYNPVNSGVYLELIDADISPVLATTVVDAVGLYYSTVALSALATFTTQVAVQNAVLGGPTGKGQFWSVAVHSGTPVLAALLGGWAAVTDGSLGNIHYDFKGKVLIPPGVLASLAMTTAASTASGITAGISWVERPV